MTRPHCSLLGTTAVRRKSRRWTIRLPHTPFSHSVCVSRFSRHPADPSPSHSCALSSIPVTRAL
eukprot:1376764-Rhodomonas_salina.1